MAFSKDQVRKLAKEYDWIEVKHNVETRVLGFIRGTERINVYYMTGTVGTCEDHLRMGKFQFFRKEVTMQNLDSIFRDVRVRTGKGYYRRLVDLDKEPKLERRQWCGVVDDSLMHDFIPPLVALGDGYFAVDNELEPYWTGDLPLEFMNVLRGRQRHLPKVDVVAFGPSDTYFVQFADGKQQWNGTSQDFDDTIFANDQSVTTIAFAPDGGYFVKFNDGTIEWMNLPTKLHSLISERNKSLPPVEEVTIGTRGEYFVRFEDGDWRSGGHTNSCTDWIDKIERKDGDIRHIAFGHNSTWLIIYEHL